MTQEISFWKYLEIYDIVIPIKMLVPYKSEAGT